MKKKELAVGDSTSVEIIFRTGHYKGKVRKSTSVRTNAKKQERLQIQATILKDADTSRPLMLEPTAIQLDEIRPDNPNRKWKFKVALLNIGEENVKVHMVSAPKGLFDVKLPGKDIKPGKERYIEFKFDDRIGQELFTKSVTFELNDEAKTRYTIPISKSRRWGPTRASQ